jgi:hypothetical protein
MRSVWAFETEFVVFERGCFWWWWWWWWWGDVVVSEGKSKRSGGQQRAFLASIVSVWSDGPRERWLALGACGIQGEKPSDGDDLAA